MHQSFVSCHTTMERDDLLDDQRPNNGHCAIFDRLRFCWTSVFLDSCTRIFVRLWHRHRLELDQSRDFESRFGAPHLSAERLVLVVLSFDTWTHLCVTWTIDDDFDHLPTSFRRHSAVLSNDHLELHYQRGTHKCELTFVPSHMLQACSHLGCEPCVRIHTFILECHSIARSHDIDLEQRSWTVECLSIRIICTWLMVFDLVRITPNLELESRITCIDCLDRMYATNRIESILSLPRYSCSINQ